MLNKIKHWLISRTAFEYFAYLFLGAGLYFFVLIFADFYYPETSSFFDIKNLGELGAVLSGTAGILWALSGVLLFFSALKYQRDELKLQRDELKENRIIMKEQSETLKTQTSESTFFRLLENHRSLVSSLSFDQENGYSGLNKFYQSLKNCTAIYCNIAITGNISNVNYGAFYPVRLLKKQIENIEQIYNSTFHIINLITQKLNNDIFYHYTLYNSLSKPEKYILGLYIINSEPDKLTTFKNHTFNYLEYFENSKESYFDKNKTPFLPNLSFKFIKPYCDFSIELYTKNKTDKSMSEIKIEAIDNELGLSIKLLDTEFTYHWSGKDNSVKDNWDLTFNKDTTINVFSFINKHILEKYILNFHETYENGHPMTLAFALKFGIEYDGNKFNYTKHFNATFQNMQINSETQFCISSNN